MMSPTKDHQRLTLAMASLKKSTCFPEFQNLKQVYFETKIDVDAASDEDSEESEHKESDSYVFKGFNNENIYLTTHLKRSSF